MTTFDKTYLASFQYNLIVCQKSVDNLIFTLNSVKKLFPLTAETLDKLSPEFLEKLDAMTARFSRLQDLMGDRLFKSLALLESEPQQRFLDVLNLMEKRGIIPSSQQWIELRNIRNEISHGYIKDTAQLAEMLTTIFNRAPELIENFQSVKQYANQVLNITEKEE